MHVLLAAGSHAEVQGTAAGTEGLLVADGLWGQTSLLVAALDLHQTDAKVFPPPPRETLSRSTAQRLPTPVIHPPQSNAQTTAEVPSSHRTHARERG